MTGRNAGANPALARILGRFDGAAPAQDGDAEPEPGRGIRVAVLRAADRAVGLSLTVQGLTDERCTPDALVAEGPAGWVLFALTAPGETGLAGLVMLDPALRSAMIEVQTMGVLLDAAEGDRPVTPTDAVLARPVVEALLQELGRAGQADLPTGMADWTLGPLPDLRAAALMLRDSDYRLLEVTVQIGGTDRRGALRLALASGPAQPEAAPEPAEVPDDWSGAFRASLELAPAELEAILGRLTLPLSQVDAFESGQLVPLGGLTLDRVHLESAGESLVRVRLGQVSGARAVKLDQTTPEMEALHCPPRPAPGPPPDDPNPQAGKTLAGAGNAAPVAVDPPEDGQGARAQSVSS
jgi:flagellar motor switch protein FliM